MRFIISLLINGLIIYACAEIFSGFRVAGYQEAVIVAFVLGVVNFFIRPILTILTLPITILTLGLFLFVINGAMILIVDGLLDGFSVAGLSWAILLSVILGLANFMNGGLDGK